MEWLKREAEFKNIEVKVDMGLIQKFANEMTSPVADINKLAQEMAQEMVDNYLDFEHIEITENGWQLK